MKNFIEKHTPKKLDDVIGNNKNILIIKKWMENPTTPLFIYGDTGIGKTLCAKLVGVEKNWTILHTDASDIRDKESTQRLFQIACTSNNIFMNKRLIIIDEVDGIADKRGSQDNGFFKEFEKILTKSLQPIIFIANNPYDNKKVRPIFEKCIKVKFDLPNKLSILKYCKEVCDKENIDYDMVALKELVEKCSNDIRALLIDLHYFSLTKKITLQDVEEIGERKKDEDVFKVLQQIFFPKDFYKTKDILSKMNIDRSLLFAWLEENIPRQYKNIVNLNNGLDVLSKADINEGRIRASNWVLLKYISDYLTIGVAYSKTEKENYGYTPFQFPKLLRGLSDSKAERGVTKNILEKIRSKMYCSLKKIHKEYLPVISLIAKTNTQNKQLIEYYGFTLEEIKSLGAKISLKEYNEIVK